VRTPPSDYGVSQVEEPAGPGSSECSYGARRLISAAEYPRPRPALA